MMKQQFSNPVNILVSYAYWCKELEEAFKRTPNLCLLIDSGAYTAYKLGKVFTVDEYCSFIDHLPVKPYGYFSLDVIGNPKETMNNYLYIGLIVLLLYYFLKPDNSYVPSQEEIQNG